MKPVLLRLMLLLLLPAVSAFAQTPDNGGAGQDMIPQLQRAENLTDVNQLKEAAPLIEEAAKLNPDYPDLYRIWGKFYEKEGQWALAEEKYNKWAALAPKSYEPFEHLGVVANTQGHYRESNTYFAEAKRMNPTRIFIINYRCHNFVEMQAWQEAIAECSEAITLDSKDEYAYAERGKAYTEVQDTGRGQKDFAAAKKSYAHPGGRLFLVNQMFAAVFGLLALTFMAMGLAVLIQKKPLLFSSRWMFALMVVCFLPQFFMQLSMGGMPGSSGSLKAMQWIMPLMFVVVLWFCWIQMQGYMVLGIVDTSFRKTLLSALDDLNLVWKEELSVIHVPSANLDIQVSIQSRTGAGQVKSKSREGQETFERIIARLRHRLAEGTQEINSTLSLFYIAIGIFMLVFSAIILDFH